MRTTIVIDETVYRSAKAEAATSGRTVSAVIEDAVRSALIERPDTAEVPSLPVFHGTGVMPGVDLADRHALADLMDGESSLDALR